MEVPASQQRWLGTDISVLPVCDNAGVVESGRDALGHHGVTRREFDVLGALEQGLKNAEIAARLGVSERTVESHVSSLLRKLDAHDRAALAARAAKLWPDLSVRGALPHQLAISERRRPCFGREGELERLRRCWEATASGTVVVVVSGEAGIGKSRLVAAAATEVHASGARVVFAACAHGTHRPYEAFVDALADDVRRMFGGVVDERLEVHRAMLGRLFPLVGGDVGSPAAEVVDASRDHSDVLSGLHACLVAMTWGQPVLFVLEDVHWASSGTRDALSHIARAAGPAPLMVLATIRDGRPEAADAVPMISRIVSLPSVETIALAGLDVAAAAAVIDGVGGRLDVAQAVHDTGGNPLFLGELARHGPGSRSLRELVAERFIGVEPQDLDVVDAAVVIGEQIDVSFLARVLDRSTGDILDALERLEAAGLVGPGSTPGRFAFTHDVFRSVRYHGFGVGRTMRLHAAVARALEGPTSDAQLAELARHACLAGPRFDPRAAATLARDAGDLAAAATDHGAAVDQYRRGLDALHLAGPSDPIFRLELEIRLGQSLVLSGDGDGQAILRRTAEEALGRGQPAAAAAALCAIAPVLGGSTSVDRPDHRFEDLGTRVLDALTTSDETWRIRLQAVLGMHVRMTASVERGTETIREAVLAARRLGDPITLGRALMTFRFCGGPLEMDERLACGHELLELGGSTGQTVFTLIGCQQLFWCHRERGDVEEMARWQNAAASRLHGPDLEQLSLEAAVAVLDGNLALATSLADGVEMIADPVSATASYVAPLRRAIADLRGHLPDRGRLRRRIDDSTVYRAMLEAMLGRALARAGRSKQAQAMLDAAARGEFEPRYEPNTSTTAGSCWAETAFICADAPAARKIVDWFEPLAGAFVDNGITVWDTVDRVRAIARLTVDDPSSAAAIAAQAVEASRRRRTPILLGRELVVLAAAQQASGADDGADAVDEALVIGRRTGALIIIHDVRLFLGHFAEPANEFGLTRREREVLTRVRAGDTNTQIAFRLDISAATVKKHLEHIYTKLGVSSRTAAAGSVRDAAAEPAHARSR